MHIEVILGDITRLKVDAIVNAANVGLLGGGGVDGAIHRAAGLRLHLACLELPRPGKTGQAYVTSAGNLPCRYVIHTPGPVWRGGGHNEEELLAACYRNSLQVAEEQKVQTIAFPCISTGVYAFPKEQAAVIALKTIRAHKAISIQKVILCCYMQEDADRYARLMQPC